jgi:hypothetical protein
MGAFHPKTSHYQSWLCHVNRSPMKKSPLKKPTPYIEKNRTFAGLKNG